MYAWGFQVVPLPSGFPAKIPQRTTPLPPLSATCPTRLIFLFDHPNIIWCTVQIMKIFLLQ